MNITVISVGRPDSSASSFVNDYFKRCSHHIRVTHTWVKAGSLDYEANLIEKKIPASSSVILLTREGDALTSREFSALISINPKTFALLWVVLMVCLHLLKNLQTNH